MMKVSVLSFPRYYNYGTYLQLFAMQKVLLQQGYEPELIDYDPYNDSGKKGALSHQLWQRLKSTVQEIRKPVEPSEQGSLAVSLARQKAQFTDFLQKDLRLSGKTYFSPVELKLDPPQADAYLVGSDQVWSPRSHFEDPAYFLHFAPAHKRIAYAPSFGVASLPEHTQAWYREQVQGIEYLSVREQAGADIIMGLTGAKAPVVLDPVFLVDHIGWQHFAAQATPRPRPYLLAYFLESDLYMRETALALAKQRGLEPVLIPVNAVDQVGFGQQFCHLDQVGPREFVSLVENAAYVCTDSFHGTSFAALFNRPFLTFKRYANPLQAANHSRIESLLHLLGLTACLTDAHKRLQPTLKSVDYAAANQRMTRLRAESMAYLTHALHSATQPCARAALAV